MRKHLIHFIAVLLMSVLSAASAQTTLQFWTISLSPFFNDYINESITLFENQHPGTSVIWTDYSSEAMSFELQAAFKSQVGPDVVNVNVPMLLTYAEQGSLWRLPESATGGYFENSLQSLRVQNAQLGLPWYVAPSVTMVNRTLFEQAGLNPDTPLDTPEAFIDAAKRIKDTLGVYGFMPNIISQNMLYRFQEAGLPVLAEDGHTAVFNSPAHVQFLQEHIDLFTQDYFPADALLRGYTGAVERYSAGQLGMLVTGPQFLSRIKDSNPDLYANTRVAPYPLDDGKLIHAPLMALSIPLNSANHDAALEFALFMTGDERQLAFSKIVSVFPSRVVAASDAFFTDVSVVSPDAQARVVEAAQLQFAQDLTMELPNSAELFRVVQTNIEAAFFGFKSAQAALDDAVRFWNAKL